MCFGVVAALLCVVFCAWCAGWRVRKKVDAHQLPKHVTIYVVMNDQVAATDSGLAAAVVDALATDLMKRDHEASIEVAKLGEKVPSTRVGKSRSGTVSAAHPQEIQLDTTPWKPGKRSV